MLLLVGGFLVLMLIGVPVAISMAAASVAYLVYLRRRARHHRRAAHDCRRGELSAARGALLHPRRQSDEHRRRHRPHLCLRAGAGRLDERRPGAGQHHRLGHLFRHVRHRARRCRRHRHDRDQGDEGPRLSGRGRGRRHGRFGDAGADLPALLALRHLRNDGQRLDRRAVHGRHRARAWS